MIKIIPTTHLTPSEEILRIIEEEQPEIIGVELCKTRFDLMIQPEVKEQPKEDNETLIGKISKSIKQKAESEGINYASDQLTASKYALENNIPLALLDRDIMETKRLMELLPTNEMQGFLTELMNFESKTLGEQTQNLNENEVLEQLRTKYPVAFEFLINSRDIYIAYKILKVMSEHPTKRFIVFLGRGHEKAIKQLLGIQ